jgi:predicted porin
MKKSLLAVAVAAALPVVAHAQVSLYGKMDVGVGSIDRGSSPAMTMIETALGQTSRLGIRGTEKMSGGMSAVFQLEGAVTADTGAAINFNRESWVGLQGGFGEVRLGRTLTPTFHADALGDIMGYSYFGGQGNWSSNGGGACSPQSGAGTATAPNAGSDIPSPVNYGTLNSRLGNATSATPSACQATAPGAYDVRFSNALLWISPSMSGLTIRAMYSAGERDGTTGTGVVSTAAGGYNAGDPVGKSSGNAFDISAIYSAGPLGIALAYQDGKGSNNGGSRQVTTAAASYALPVATLKGGWSKSDATDRVGSGQLGELTKMNIGASFKLGVGTMMVAYSQFERDALGTVAARAAHILGLASNHPLSKHTSVYATYGRTDNKTAVSQYGLYAGGVNYSPTGAGVDLAGFGAGIIHNF